ncbi:glutamine-hydrolyzing carbamoyl-phosphate synthase small subunit [Prochlorococcus marinus]|uniref:Carbamoyl phosphate synthase small chain n=1 Tax=Prochlorococcus marinus XMU1408 TaxID=2213228 RepID=A0A318RAX4_PROMR|nr:glutamine-hydrolyzing carbamoyl-phosphate synthase small subunit [Prochlorococcus marinus]MBW3041888.1 carbamoyl phosphate synthase small subunit [Prochlorococcus marinus str. XMU1408]PYE03019.1 carbamoyl phosphate synthase small subunit [Prochlorococcus marinus XMU1408]
MFFDTECSAILLLEDGTYFEGISFGAVGTISGEVVFNTGMTGYQEVITDPSYYGQLITFTYPEIGNTGVNPEDNESLHPSVKGLITRQISNVSSNWRNKIDFDQWLKNENVVGIRGIDTRVLVRHLRESGTLNGIISSDSSLTITELFSDLKKSPNMSGLNLVDKVTTKDSFKVISSCPVAFDKRIKNIKTNPYKIIAIDFGIKKSILDRLVAHGCEVTVLPASASISDVLDLSPEGVFLSNGPGDPAAVDSGIKLAKELIKYEKLPVFGICLGHQILGLALGGKTFKLSYGHRGLNHPCGLNGKVEITSQNHGFALNSESLNSERIKITRFNLNDQTVAAISVIDKPFFGVQYHPEASPGPHDADHHFNHFVTLIEERRRFVD